MSVRLRLTILIGLLIAAIAAAAAVLAPSLVERALVDDILDADAELQSLFFDDSPGFFDGGFGSDKGFIDVFDFIAGDIVVDQIGGERLQELIASGGSDDLVVAVGGDKFLRVDASGSQTFESIDPTAVDQPILTFFGLFDGGFSRTISPFDDFPVDVVDAGGFDDSFFAQFDETGRTVTGVREVGGVEYFVSGEAGSVDRTVGRVRAALWMAFPFAVLAGALVTWLLAGRALRPVRAITAQAATITGGTLSERVPVPASGDEIATLANTVNGMLDRLESDDVSRRQFVSDASHELRTPVAVLKSEAEVALRSPDLTDVEALASGVLEESTRMATIIDDLLSLARRDEGVAAPTTEIDLDDIVLAEAGRLRRVPVDVSAVSAGRVLGRLDEFSRVVAHLLDNATRHAETTVAVGLVIAAGQVRLTIDDDGPGVPVADREVIFERFARLDEARSRDVGGAGLGLAVVAGVVQRSNGSVAVETSPSGGARFVVTLPAT
jgi:signal transduction histidine kinase